MRRAFDLTVAACALVVVAPALALIALLIRIADGRPVLFRQRRAGRHGELFEILKFRTMKNERAQASITAASDHRITALGRHLRRFKLDELPQLINVVRGEMSLIGARPEVPKFVDLRSAEWEKILQSRPGITDLASLFYRDEEEMLRGVFDPEETYRREILPGKLRLNLFYAARRNWRLDAQVLVLTVFYSLFPAAFDRRKVARRFAIDGAASRAAQPRRDVIGVG